jgi:hypothetical protein
MSFIDLQPQVMKITSYLPMVGGSLQVGVFNFGTSYLGAKIGQNKTMTKISRFTVYKRYKRH